MKTHILNLLKKHYAIFTYLTTYFIIFAHKFITAPTPFYDWDESIYAQVAKEMINRVALVPLWQGQVWLDKPPFVPFFYGLVFKLTPFTSPEISGRITTLALSITVLGMLYALYYKVIKETVFTTLVIFLTSVTPIFLQRSQALNIDVFLLIGWIGYILFHKNFRLSLFFLSLGVLSKSLVGYYPAAIVLIYYGYLYFTKQIKKKEFSTHLKNIGIQIGIVSLWYVIMLLIYGKAFLIQHIYETHFKRVSASIESHFGQRTYYIDLLFQQFTGSDLFVWPVQSITVFVAILIVIGGNLLLYRHVKKTKINNEELLFATFIIPWFLFLNLAKTKIFWYSYPYIPQFAFLILYPLAILKKKTAVYYTVLLVVFIFLAQYFFWQKQILKEEFSKYEAHQLIAQSAKKNCTELEVVVSPDGRTTYDTLNNMGLTITTTTWWGEHPSMVYYFGKKINFIYTVDNFATLIQSMPKPACLVVTQGDYQKNKNIQSLRLVKKNADFYLLQK